MVMGSSPAFARMSRTVGIRFASPAAVLSLTPRGQRHLVVLAAPRPHPRVNRHPLLSARVDLCVQPVEKTDPEGIDHGWVMQMTFVLTILVGAPVVTILSTQTTLPTWGARASFAIRVGAVIWFLTSFVVYLYARRTQSEDS